jgi:hypothetical protein
VVAQIEKCIADVKSAVIKNRWKPTDSAWQRAFGQMSGLYCARSLIQSAAHGGSFQDRVQPWMMECFGPEISGDKVERNYRFLEEALELVQACGCSQQEAVRMVEYVYGRDQGDINQEVGGVMVTLAALCLASGFDMHVEAERELARVWTKVDQIRAKQAGKPKSISRSAHGGGTKGGEV